MDSFLLSSAQLYISLGCQIIFEHIAVIFNSVKHYYMWQALVVGLVVEI